MTSINLLPWREALRKERQQKFYIALGISVVIMALVILGVHSQYSLMIDYQQARNNFLDQQIAHLDKQIAEIKTLEEQKDKLLARMNVIQQLQQGRPKVVHVFDELAKTLPDGVFLTSLKQDKSSVLIEGFAQSNARVSAYMRNLDASPWFTDPKLDVIQATGKTPEDHASKFTLNVQVVGAQQEDAG